VCDPRNNRTEPLGRRRRDALLRDPRQHARVNIREAVQISSLKGDQISAQGFNPGLGNLRRCAVKGHHSPARHIGSKSFACVSSLSRHFQGAFLRGRHPRLKPGLRSFAPSASGRRPCTFSIGRNEKLENQRWRAMSSDARRRSISHGIAT
jgi:hypothetical protein